MKYFHGKKGVLPYLVAKGVQETAGPSKESGISSNRKKAGTNAALFVASLIQMGVFDFYLNNY
jgi:hypothetical protein